MSAIPLSQVAVQLRPQDNLAVVTKPISAGTILERNGEKLSISSRIGLGHKLALQPIKKGDPVFKYGQIIGFASKDIEPGEHIHTHNVSAEAFERDYAFCQD